MDALLRLKASVSGENDIKRLGNSMQGVQGKVKNLRGSVGRLGGAFKALFAACLLYTSPSPRDYAASRMPSSA